MVMTAFGKFSRSLENLQRASSDSEVIDSFIATFEAACTVIQQGLALPDLDTNDRRTIIRKAYERNLIQNPAWLKLLYISYKPREDYTGEIIRAIRGEYMRCFRELHNKLESKQLNSMGLFNE